MQSLCVRVNGSGPVTGQTPQNVHSARTLCQIEGSLQQCSKPKPGTEGDGTRSERQHNQNP